MAAAARAAAAVRAATTAQPAEAWQGRALGGCWHPPVRAASPLAPLMLPEVLYQAPLSP